MSGRWFDRVNVIAAALAFAQLPPHARELRLLPRCLGCPRAMPTLVAATLCGVLVALPDVQAHASEMCVEDARAALEAKLPPGAFGPEAIVTGPKTIETIEQEEFATIVTSNCFDCPAEPFGHQYPEWQRFKALVRPGDCIMFFRSNPYSWDHGFGSEGYVLVRQGRIVEVLTGKLQ